MAKSKIPAYLTIGDSSTVVVRGISALLNNRSFDPFLATGIQKIGASILNHFPKNIRKLMMEQMVGTIAANIELADDVNSTELTSWVVGEYPEKQYDSIIIGSPSGGVGHLASYLNSPFLTQHFLMGFKGTFPIDDSERYMDGCFRSAQRITDKNPDLFAIIHYDPIHDRFIVKKTGFIRVKLLSLHDVYRDFISRSLKPGGTIVLIGCRYPWSQYEISDRINFQLGGLGGVSYEEYYKGSDRIVKYINRERRSSERTAFQIKHEDWLLRAYGQNLYPESEWGLLPSFADDVRSFADSNRYRVVEIMPDHPDQLGEIMYRAFTVLIQKEHGEMNRRIFMDSFTNSSPVFNRKVSACPLWLPFICDDSYNFATRILDTEAKTTEILLALHPSFSDPFDLTPLDKWMSYLSRFKNVNLIGVNDKKYPADLTAYFKFTEDTISYAGNNHKPLKSFGTIDNLLPFVNAILNA
ncbi:MAG: hypothetical protein ABIG42_02680 [bacterium]